MIWFAAFRKKIIQKIEGFQKQTGFVDVEKKKEIHFTSGSCHVYSESYSRWCSVSDIELSHMVWRRW